MTRRHSLLRQSASLLLAAILALASVTMAVARNQATGSTDMVICSAYGVVTITLDAQGNPAGPVHPCPDCLSSLGPALLPGVDQPTRPQTRARTATTAPQPRATSRTPPAATARGPPLTA